jgi:hypothetical protein
VNPLAAILRPAYRRVNAKGLLREVQAVEDGLGVVGGSLPQIFLKLLHSLFHPCEQFVFQVSLATSLEDSLHGLTLVVQRNVATGAPRLPILRRH